MRAVRIAGKGGDRLEVRPIDRVNASALRGVSDLGAEVSLKPKKECKSFHYKVRTTWSSARRGILAAPGKANIVVGSPPEFGGKPDDWAPEELLVASLNTCMMLTFLTLAQAQGVSPLETPIAVVPAMPSNLLSACTLAIRRWSAIHLIQLSSA